MSDSVILRFSTGKWTIHCSIKFTFCCTVATRSCGLEFVWKALLVSLFLWKGLFSVNFTIQRVAFWKGCLSKKILLHTEVLSARFEVGVAHIEEQQDRPRQSFENCICYVLWFTLKFLWPGICHWWLWP